MSAVAGAAFLFQGLAEGVAGLAGLLFAAGAWFLLHGLSGVDGRVETAEELVIEADGGEPSMVG